jgi:hypothetical protein
LSFPTFTGLLKARIAARVNYVCGCSISPPALTITDENLLLGAPARTWRCTGEGELLFALIHSGPILPELVEGGNRRVLPVSWRFCPIAKTLEKGLEARLRQRDYSFMKLVADDNGRLARKSLFTPKRAFSAERQADGSIRLVNWWRKRSRWFARAK